MRVIWKVYNTHDKQEESSNLLLQSGFRMSHLRVLYR